VQAVADVGLTCSAFASSASAALVLPARCSVRMAASHSSGCLGLRCRAWGQTTHQHQQLVSKHGFYAVTGKLSTPHKQHTTTAGSGCGIKALFDATHLL
jgi:hypothetical protein